MLSFVSAEGDRSLNDPVCCAETMYFLKLDGCPAWIVNLLEKVGSKYALAKCKIYVHDLIHNKKI